jgi:hypothetical protein
MVILLNVTCRERDDDDDAMHTMSLFTRHLISHVSRVKKDLSAACVRDSGTLVLIFFSDI